MKKLLIYCVSLFLCACTHKVYSLHPQSHFDYPNSNVRPIASTSGTASEMALGLTPGLSGELKRMAIDSALKKQAGADILVNYIAEAKITSFLILPISAITYTVHGTASKMEVGKQYLK